MFHRSVGVALGAAVLAALVAQSRVAGAEATDDAEKLIRHGIELRKAHDDEGAARAFQQAYDQVHTPRAAGQLGLAEQALGRWEDAERHVGEALRTGGDPWVAKNRATLDEALGMIQAHLGRVEIIGDPEGAEVSVNGRSVGKLPLQGAVRVSAGEVEVEIHAPGYVMAQRTLTIVGGQYQRLVLHLTKEAIAQSATPGPRRARRTRRTRTEGRWQRRCAGGRRPAAPRNLRRGVVRAPLAASHRPQVERCGCGGRRAGNRRDRRDRALEQRLCVRRPPTGLRGRQRHCEARGWHLGPGVPGRSERLPQRPHLGDRRIRQRRCVRRDLVGPRAHGELWLGRCRARARGSAVRAVVVRYRCRVCISLLKKVA